MQEYASGYNLSSGIYVSANTSRINSRYSHDGGLFIFQEYNRKKNFTLSENLRIEQVLPGAGEFTEGLPAASSSGAQKHRAQKI